MDNLGLSFSSLPCDWDGWEVLTSHDGQSVSRLSFDSRACLKLWKSKSRRSQSSFMGTKETGAQGVVAGNP
jgi:hypothetical protein